MAQLRHSRHALRRAIAVAAAVVLSAVTVQVAGVMPARALGLPITIDDFKGTTFGTRTVTTLPLPGASTTAPGTFQQNGDGTATMTMNGNGNGVGGVQLDYTDTTAGGVDLTAGGSNTQFFIDFHSIQRLPVQTVGETALNLSVQVTDTSNHSGTLNTGISNVFAFSPSSSTMRLLIRTCSSRIFGPFARISLAMYFCEIPTGVCPIRKRIRRSSTPRSAATVR